jgi:hypothetical protein
VRETRMRESIAVCRGADFGSPKPDELLTPPQSWLTCEELLILLLLSLDLRSYHSYLVYCVNGPKSS